VIASLAQIRNKIDDTRLSYEGYKRQLAHLTLSPERRDRLETEIRLMEEEIATLEKIAQLSRVEPDRDRVEAIVRERLAVVRQRLAADPDLASLSDDERDYASGEVKALLALLGEDTLSRITDELSRRREPPTPADAHARANQAAAAMLVHKLQNDQDRDTRAGAAYELGRLHILTAIPHLAAALDGDSMVAEMALRSLCAFSDDELGAAGLDNALLNRVRSAR
jgi:predicted HTH domain antitoxin